MPIFLGMSWGRLGAVPRGYGLITQRSLVQIQPPLPRKSRGCGMVRNPFFVPGVHIGVQSADRGPWIGRSEVGIAEGHLDVFVPQEFLDGHEVYPGHDKVRGEAVAQVMEHEPHNFGFPERSMKAFPDVHKPTPCLTWKDM